MGAEAGGGGKGGVCALSGEARRHPVQRLRIKVALL